MIDAAFLIEAAMAGAQGTRLAGHPAWSDALPSIVENTTVSLKATLKSLSVERLHDGCFASAGYESIPARKQRVDINPRSCLPAA
ncbi:hypothetical protein FHP25_22890 [Vineibacter terrae]|uniref:Uncharacterized protein n=1 Tax=Vineibacter terrae TaxID=2586908 RepID=A0A5C8PGU0_9HYPH|nr:hypothetical protein [Vineibacter terrae]TXL73044.1 hypothetical protein FHP25_22890 [Vineibacter terrae]